MLRAMDTSQRVTPDDSIEDLLARHPGAARVLVDYGMHCVGCVIAPFETIAEACANYGVPTDELIAALDRSAAAERMAQP